MTLFDVDTSGTGGGVGKTHACAGRFCGVCHSAARAARDAKITQADDHADAEWRDHADSIIRAHARTGCDFTTDEVMETLAAGPFSTHEPRALGAVVKRLISQGVIVQTGWARSRRRHASPIPVYCGVKR